ncbi:rab9 effector protein with kelch motifs-like [Impatiens glandulifera]|uniref:rab9 effector protein with kelch motifs-like n=1 Tax=Impatiens glandulifera TaxID=253017 RepID=UPI001FB13520|nr:rab9 effector protein with kelch motifs-like [Impatiens glandulifera]
MASSDQAMWVYPMMLSSGFNPTERWGHSSCYYNGLIYVFGGCCGGIHFSDVVALNVQTMAWTTVLTSGEGPGPRDSHTAVLVGHKMVVFGGTTGFKKVNDLHILDLRSKIWTRPICGGVMPSPRESHTTTVVSDDKLVVFGGSGEGDANYLNDLHILDLNNMIWSVCPTLNGDVPVPRDSHCAVAVGTKIYVYGGDCGDRYQADVNVLDIQTFTWSKLATRGPWPGPRAGHAAFAIGFKMYVIGGVGNKKYYNDVWVLDTNGGSWTRVEISGPQPQGRFSHTAVVAHNSDIIIYGGCGEDEHPLRELVVVRSVDKRKMDDFLVRNSIYNSKRMRRVNNSKIVEIESESEPEEHSLSLSQHSSPSQSDQEPAITTVKKTPPPSFLLHQKQGTTHHNFLHETQNKPKTVQHIRARLGTRLGRHEPDEKKTLETVNFPTMNGTEVRGKIDGCFDSGYLMTAVVNGRAYRGVLFANPTNQFNGEPVVNSSTPNQRQVSSQGKSSPECGGGQGFRQPSSMAVRNDLKGVVLTLGGACSSHAEI